MSKFRSLFLLSVLLLTLLTISACSKSDDASSSSDATYTISGTVTGADNVTITLSGDESASTVINDGETYTFTVSDGSYQVTPSAAGYVFSPPGASVTVNGSNMTVYFEATASALSYTVSGLVTGAANVTMNINGEATGSFVTGASGSIYTSPALAAGNYVLTPYLSGYAFTPANVSLSLSSNTTSVNFTATAAAFTQADVTGNWHVFMLSPGKEQRAIVRFNSAGNMTNISDCNENGSDVTCPTSLAWTINTSTGVITESGSDANTNAHLTMASDKHFIGGTADNEKIIVALKENDLVSYSSSDLQSKSFVYHSLETGSSSSWEYGAGTVASNSEITRTSKTLPDGTGSNTSTTTKDLGAISVSSSGIVTMSGAGDPNFVGFLSHDKRTIVGTTYGTGTYIMLIIQITDGQSSSTSGANGTWYDHMLAVGSSSDAPFWAHISMAIASGTMTFNSDWVSSSSATGPDSTETISIASSGTATLSGSDTAQATFHGQASYNGAYMIATQTLDAGTYSLMIITKK